MDIDDDGGVVDVPAPMDLDRDHDRDEYGIRAALVILAGILRRLRDTRAAARTSLLSHRWRHVWKWVSGLYLHYQPNDSSAVRTALAAHPVHAVTNIHKLYVVSLLSATPDATASWLLVAAPLIFGELGFCNRAWIPVHMLFNEVFSETIEETGALELPCFTRATKITLRLGFLGLSLPPSGVFAALRELRLSCIQFHGELTLDDTVMPFLEGLEIYCTRGLASLTLRLKHLYVRGLLGLNAVVPRLKFLTPSLVTTAGVCIVAEELMVLKWLDWYCPGLVKFIQMPRLRVLSVSPFYPYGRHRQHTIVNPSCDRLLKLFSRIHLLGLAFSLGADLGHLGGVNPLMEGITRLPDIRFLHLQFSAHGHVYGASVLYMLTMRTGISNLRIKGARYEVQDVCSPNCSCDRPPNWTDNKDISMRSLREVQILNFRGKEHELDLLRVLVRVATGIRRIRITCHRSFAAWERLSADIRSFARPETSVEVSQAPPSLQPRSREQGPKYMNREKETTDLTLSWATAARRGRQHFRSWKS
uniref:FBD domain-containing protein n=1 Tax=Oryza punctata TaxID=4537 RepID=A0A0E0LLZ0_ORYPU